MGLIFSSFIKLGYIHVELLSTQYLEIPKKYLSSPFELTTWSLVSGTILEINSSMGLDQSDIAILNELKGTQVKLYLQVMVLGTKDYLYFSSETWNILRDYGILPDEYNFKIRLTELRVDGDRKNIYPKRDVTVIN